MTHKMFMPAFSVCFYQGWDVGPLAASIDQEPDSRSRIDVITLPSKTFMFRIWRIILGFTRQSYSGNSLACFLKQAPRSSQPSLYQSPENKHLHIRTVMDDWFLVLWCYTMWNKLKLKFDFCQCNNWPSRNQIILPHYMDIFLKPL